MEISKKKKMTITETVRVNDYNTCANNCIYIKGFESGIRGCLKYGQGLRTGDFGSRRCRECQEEFKIKG
jgi:hypothetical protein